MKKNIYKYADKYYSFIKIMEEEKIAYLVEKQYNEIEIKKTKYNIENIDKVFFEILKNDKEIKLYSYVINKWGDCALDDKKFNNINDAKAYLLKNFNQLVEYGGVRLFFIIEKYDNILIEPTHREDIFILEFEKNN